MSTEDPSGVEFTLLLEEHQQHFRLLELPPDLLNLVTSENPPLIHLKAAGQSPNPQNSHAVLCTPDKTYSIRQVGTSNSLYIAQGSLGSDDLPNERLQAIGKAQSTLELLPISSVDVQSHLNSLPVYTSTGLAGSTERMTKSQLFRNIPASSCECERAWTALACFELEDPPRCFVPSKAIAWKIWQNLKTLADATSVDLTAPISDFQMNGMIKEIDDAPAELVYSLLKSLSSQWNHNHLQLSDRLCVRFIGLGLLQERTGQTASLPIHDFHVAWKDQLPRQWESLAELDVLSPLYRLEENGALIRLIDAETEKSPSMSGTRARGKWHEKFRTSKKPS